MMNTVAYYPSASNSLRMVEAGVLPQVRDWDQDPPAYSPGGQSLRCHQIVKRTLADRQHLGCFLAAHENLVFRRNRNPLWGLPAIRLEPCS